MRDLLIRQSPSPTQSREATSLSSAELQPQRDQEHNPQERLLPVLQIGYCIPDTRWRAR